jgi:ELWxxDGT repeat protein
LQDIRPGTAGSFPHGFFQASNAIYFQAADELHGSELWRTDGSEEGTWLVKDINPGTGSSSTTVALYHMAEVNGLTFFWADEPVHGVELWMTDGTEAGTALVADLDPSRQSSTPGRNRALKGIGNRLYFTATDAVSGEELWMLQVPQRPHLQVERGQDALVINTTGEAHQARIIEQTADFVTWTALATNTADANGLSRHTSGLVGTNLFFRVRGLTGPP